MMQTEKQRTGRGWLWLATMLASMAAMIGPRASHALAGTGAGGVGDGVAEQGVFMAASCAWDQVAVEICDAAETPELPPIQ